VRLFFGENLVSERKYLDNLNKNWTPSINKPNFAAMNYFQFYEIPERFQLDKNAVRTIFLKNSRQFHPDFHTQERDERQAEILELSTKNNEAFQTLSDPILRMAHILKNHGFLGDETKNRALSPDFLMKMMEINENLMELEFDFDQSAFEKTKTEIDDFKKNMDDEIAEILQNWTPETSKNADLAVVENYFLKNKYFLRIFEKVSTFAALSNGTAN
jgi:molecular chaperone HscB